MGETTAVAHGGDPLWRHCLPKTALHRYISGRAGCPLYEYSFKD
ncbi:hypothetical protein [Moorena sp. SIO3F7]|nr:hypothetical protein [Moorena sp. SIO3F7]